MKKLILSATTLILITGCANLTPMTQLPKYNPTLPTVKNLKAYPGRNQIALYWSTVPNMSGYYIQRYNFKDKRWIQIATIHNPYKSIYVDANLKPSHTYEYKIETFNKKGIPSLARKVTVTTLPRLAPVIILEAKPVVKGTVKIIFRPDPNERVDEYIVQRFDDKNAKWENIATLKPRLNVEYIDTGLKNGKIYKYRIFAKSFDGILSYPSKTISVLTFPNPPVVLNVTATTNQPKEIIVKFSPVKDAAYYKIYISNSPNGDFKFYKTTKSTTFVDYIGKDGFIRYYKVIAVSPHGTQSILNETPSVMGETLPRPTAPLVSVNKMKNQIEFIFTSPDHRAKKYLIIRKENIGLFKSVEKKFIATSNKFVDVINPKYSYEYKIYEVDKYGLISKKPTVIEVGE